MRFTRETIQQACQSILDDLEGVGKTPHPDQITAIESVLIDKTKTLLVQPVGWGKSLVYWTLADLIRRAELGFVVIVSPLLALMHDQISAGRKAGLRVDTWNSTNAKYHDNIRQQIIDDELDVLILTPEQLAKPGFTELITGEIFLVVIDEAQCISQWGYQFRPDYLRISQALGSLPEVNLLATTATAPTEIEQDIIKELGGDVKVIRGPLANPSLSFNVIQDIPRDKQIQFLDKALCNLDNGGIIYLHNKARAMILAQELSSRGHKAVGYHADLSNEDKRLLELRWRNNEYKAIVSTSALGMGINKKDVPYVINLGITPSITDYFQQSGRGGRNGQLSEALLIADKRADSKLVRNYPTKDLLKKTDLILLHEVLKNIRYPMKATDLALESRILPDHVATLLKILARENAVDQTPDGWYCIDDNWVFDDERHEAIIARRTDEVLRMRDYTTTSQCLENYLLKHLGDAAITDECGRCSNCKGELPKQFRFGY